MVEETLQAIANYEQLNIPQEANVFKQDLQFDTNSLMKSVSQQFLTNATITGNVIFQFGNSGKKRRIRVIDSDSDSE